MFPHACAAADAAAQESILTQPHRKEGIPITRQRRQTVVAVLAALTLLAGAPALALAAEGGGSNNSTAEGSANTEVNGSNIKATNVGASVENSDNSKAKGDGEQIIDNNGTPISGKIKASNVGALVQNSDNSVAVGYASQVINNCGAEKSGAPLIAENYGAAAIEGANNVAIGVNAQTVSGKELKAVGYGAVAGYGDYNVAIGNHAWAGGSSAEGGPRSNENTAIGSDAQASGGNSVAIGAGSIANEPNTVSVGAYNAERRVTNMAPGVYSTDAVNMSQLWGTQNKINRLGATAMAMTGLAPMAYNKDEPTQYSAAVGTYGGQQGFAFGVYHYTKDTIMYNAAIGWSNGGWEKAGRVGVTWLGGGHKKAEPDTTLYVSNVPGDQTATSGTAPAANGGSAPGGIVDRVNGILQENAQ